MSSRHAILEPTEEGWRISDLGSNNGTFVWGKRRSTALLGDGDLFDAGSTFWVFRSQPLTIPVPKGPVGTGPLETINPRMMVLHDKLARIAKSRVPLVIRGETGTGKEVLARAAHFASGRSGRLVVADMGAIGPIRYAEELFGEVDGARAGRLRLAEGGTVLLDHIGDMSAEAQAALVRVIQDGEVTPVGADEPVELDLRFITTSHEDIEGLLEVGAFREDLWARIRGAELSVPPLRSRIDDIGLLIHRFLVAQGRSHLTFGTSAYRALLSYPWPHNVRELEQALESAAALCDGQKIELADLPGDVQAHKPPRAVEQRITDDGRERELLRLLAAHRGNVSAVARSMGYSRMQVHRWMKQMKVDPTVFRP